MAKPVNKITGDAPDSTNPDKKQVPSPPEGKFKYTPPKPNPKDAGVFTEEMLQRSGGKMKTIPENPEVAKKRGGSIRRYARGGEIMDTEVVDEKEASDKEAGLKASKGEDVGFFKRLSMGNIDEPGSEAYQQFGAGRGRMPGPRQAVSRDVNEGFEEKFTQRPSVKPPSLEVAPQVTKQKESSPEKYSDFGDNKGTGTIKYSSDFNEEKAKAPVKGVKKVIAATNKASPKVSTASNWNKNEEEGTIANPVSPKMDKIPGDYKEVMRVNALRRRMGMPVDEDYQEELRKLDFKKRTGMAGGGKVKEEDKETFLYPRDTGKETFLEKNPDIMKRGTKPPEIIGEIKNLDSRAVRDRKTAQMLIAQDEKLANNRRDEEFNPKPRPAYKQGGNIKKYASGGSVSASSRGDGCAQRGKTRGMMR